MKKKNKPSLIRLLRFIYLKLFRINDSPQKIAQGFGLGVFLGILPGTGPIAALFLAFILRVNRIGALLGSVLTNTWLSFLIFPLSIKVGSIIMDLRWQEVNSNWLRFLKEFRFRDLCKLSVLKIILPVIVGFFVIAFCLGLLTYLIALIILKQTRKYGDRHGDKSRINIPG
jgi:uncharacterized protein (DUF2062 family)